MTENQRWEAVERASLREILENQALTLIELRKEVEDLKTELVALRLKVLATAE